MRSTTKAAAIILVALSTMGETVYAQQPPDVVNSDADGNTAMGTNALLTLATGSSLNTATGTGALKADTRRLRTWAR